MNILIIEDEQPAINKLERFLKEMDENYRITGILGSVEESLNWLHSNPPPDLILMDIQLEDGLCFEIFENLSIKSPVIFTTAYDEYTLRAFKVNSVDYLLKPIQQQELKKALDKFREFHTPGSSKNWTREILGSFGSGTKERFLVKSGTYYRSVPVKDIYCFYVKMKYNFLYTSEGRNYDIGYTLDELEKSLDPRRFFRVNRKFIVNISAIRESLIYSSRRIRIILHHWSEDEEIIVSRERVNDFKNWLDR